MHVTKIEKCSTTQSKLTFVLTKQDLVDIDKRTAMALAQALRIQNLETRPPEVLLKRYGEQYRQQWSEELNCVIEPYVHQALGVIVFSGEFIDVIDHDREIAIVFTHESRKPIEGYKGMPMRQLAMAIALEHIVQILQESGCTVLDAQGPGAVDFCVP